jgi:cell wall-associated NlpC family hydrolase
MKIKFAHLLISVAVFASAATGCSAVDKPATEVIGGDYFDYTGTDSTRATSASTEQSTYTIPVSSSDDDEVIPATSAKTVSATTVSATTHKTTNAVDTLVNTTKITTPKTTALTTPKTTKALPAANAKIYAQDFLNIARAEVGYQEEPPLSNKTKYNKWYYGGANNKCEWCIVFISWVFNQAGGAIPGGKTNSTTTLLNAYNARGKLYLETSGYTPKPGDIVFLNFQDVGENVWQHAGILEYIGADGYHTIDGNTILNDTDDPDDGQFVARRVRPFVSKYGDKVTHIRKLAFGSNNFIQATPTTTETTVTTTTTTASPITTTATTTATNTTAPPQSASAVQSETPSEPPRL